jgi:LysR family hydrogen peroxide-inducible transcriptional activator
VPSLQQLRYVTLIAETLHFRRAAERAQCHPAHAVGAAVEAGGRAWRATGGAIAARVVMTPEGEEIATRARRILADVAEIAEIARRGQAMLAGTIRVGVVQSLGSYFLPLVIPDLHLRYPDLRLYVREGLADDLVRRLEDGSLDLLFFPLPVTGSEFAVARLFREPLLAVAAVDHPIAQLDRVPPERLAGERILTLETGHRLHDQVRRISEQTGAEISLDYGATSLDTIRQMVAMNLGISSFARALRPVRGAAEPDGHLAPARRPAALPGHRHGLAGTCRARGRLPRTGAGNSADPAGHGAGGHGRRLNALRFLGT